MSLSSLSCFITLRPDDGATLLSAAAVQEMTSRTMSTLAQVQHFFAFHMLANYCCDLSTSGLNMDSVHSKLNTFFEQRTNEGPRYDTYLLYYCGDVYDNGDWAFSGRILVFRVLSASAELVRAFVRNWARCAFCLLLVCCSCVFYGR